MDEEYFDFEPNERMCKSASETLDQYIREYDARREMSRSLTCKKTKKKSSRILDSLRNDLSALDEEILLAKQLFPEESFDLSIDERSLTTEELLMEQPLNTSFRTSSPLRREQPLYTSFRTPSPVRREESSFLGLADLQQEDYVYQERRSHQRQRSASSLSTIDSNHPNLRGLRTFLRDDKRRRSTEYRWSAPNTPATKYSRSKISSEDIKGELTVAMNYLPRRCNSTLDTEGDGRSQSMNARVCHYKEVKSEDMEKDGHITVSLQLEGKPASVREFMGECFAENLSNENPTSSNPGERTVESLKNMLFSLQEISNGARTELGINGESNDVDTSGCESLEKAMKHLVILKNLVKEVGNADRGGK